MPRRKHPAGMSESEYRRRAKRDLPGLIRKGIKAAEELFDDHDLESINELADRGKPVSARKQKTPAGKP
ncbi:MAG: hypothetical protein HYS44_01615 [Candidatus Niyogibacteria bacterium]|nr:hypothetical protein [Candidatus Niyogibacteria bacterium]